MENKKTNVHIGIMPPPLGGISVYLHRLSKVSPNDIFLNEAKMNKLAILRALMAKDRHFFYNGLSRYCFLCLLISAFLRRNSYTLIFHGQNLEKNYDSSRFFNRCFLKIILIYAVSIQAVNPQIKEFICDVIKVKAEKVFVQHAFLPPPLEDEEEILSTYELELHDFINHHSPLVIANAFRLNFFNGVDLYGLDMCVKLVLDLKKEYPEMGLLFALADDSNQAYLQEIKERLTQYNINDHFYFMTGQKELWPLFKKADLMVRPTCTDGDALSIREALYFRCPVVASDVCPRLGKIIIFSARNQEEFNGKVRQTIDEGFDFSTRKDH